MIQFRFLNIPVTIHPSFFLFLLFFTGFHQSMSIEGIMLGAIMFISLLVHEYGHALTAMYYGASPEINLEAFGGNARYSSFRITPKQQCMITINGPLFECALIVIPFLLLKTSIAHNPYVYYFLYQTMKLNILWCLFNLIPVYPLDGGHILQYILEERFGEKGLRACHLIGNVSAVFGGAYFFVEGMYFFAGILLVYGIKSGLNSKVTRRPSGFSPFSLYNKGLSHVEQQEWEMAKTVFKKLLKSEDERIKTLSAESYASILFQENKKNEAYKTLMKSNPQYLTKGKTLLCKLAFEDGNYALIEKHSREIYQVDPSFETAILNSKAFAALNDAFSAGGWLKTASMFQNISKMDIENILQHSIYDCVRDKDEFKSVLDFK